MTVTLPSQTPPMPANIVTAGPDQPAPSTAAAVDHTHGTPPVAANIEGQS